LPKCLPPSADRETVHSFPKWFGPFGELRACGIPAITLMSIPIITEIPFDRFRASGGAGGRLAAASSPEVSAPAFRAILPESVAI
jgi:hypothetical protein